MAVSGATNLRIHRSCLGSASQASMRSMRMNTLLVITLINASKIVHNRVKLVARRKRRALYVTCRQKGISAWRSRSCSIRRFINVIMAMGSSVMSQNTCSSVKSCTGIVAAQHQFPASILCEEAKTTVRNVWKVHLTLSGKLYAIIR